MVNELLSKLLETRLHGTICLPVPGHWYNPLYRTNAESTQSSAISQTHPETREDIVIVTQAAFANHLILTYIVALWTRASDLIEVMWDGKARSELTSIRSPESSISLTSTEAKKEKCSCQQECTYTK